MCHDVTSFLGTYTCTHLSLLIFPFDGQSENANFRLFETSVTNLRRSHAFEKVLFSSQIMKVGLWLLLRTSTARSKLIPDLVTHCAVIPVRVIIS